MTTPQQRLLNDALSKFKDHQIVRETEDVISFRRRDSGMYSVRFLNGGNSLLLWGDIDTACFAYCPVEYTLRRKIAWIGKSGPQYIREKWTLGMGFDAKAWECDAAEADLSQMIQEFQEEHPEDQRTSEEQMSLESLEAAKEAASHNAEMDCWSALGELPWCGEEYAHVGMRTRPRVIWAWAACTALVEALKATDTL